MNPDSGCIGEEESEFRKELIVVIFILTFALSPNF
jgi:hypothetical protein